MHALKIMCAMGLLSCGGSRACSLYHPCDWPRGRGWGLFCGVDGEGDGPEAVVVGALGVVVEDFTCFTELEAFDVEFLEEIGVEGYVEYGPQAPRVSLFAAAALGAGGPPFSLESVDIDLPSVCWADGAPHLLLEAGGHGFLGLVGEVDPSDVAEAPIKHVLDYVVSDPGLIGVNSPVVSPIVLDPLDVPGDGAVARLRGKLVTVVEVEVAFQPLNNLNH